MMAESLSENRRMTDNCPPWLHDKIKVLEDVNSNIKLLEQRLETLITQVAKYDNLAEITITNKFSLKLIGIGLVLMMPCLISWNVFINSEIQDLRKQVTILEAKPKP